MCCGGRDVDICVFGGFGGGVERGGNCDDGGPLWTNGQHGYKIDCLIIMYYNCTGVEWSSDAPKQLIRQSSNTRKWRGGSLQNQRAELLWLT